MIETWLVTIAICTVLSTLAFIRTLELARRIKTP